MLFVAGPEDAPTDEFESWARVVAAADGRLAAGYETFPFASLIVASSPGIGPKLAARSALGSTTLRPVMGPFVQRWPSMPPMIGHESSALACPVAAEGMAAGYNAEHAMLGGESHDL